MMLSPHLAVGTAIQAPPTPAALGQVNPGSTCEQSAEQPSLPTVLPSSHASTPLSTPSPQYSSLTQGWPGAGQCHPASSWHVAEQPSPSALALSSHCSPLLTTPSPHLAVITGTHACPAIEHAKPGSTWHS